jgi:hypothetical protein
MKMMYFGSIFWHLCYAIRKFYNLINTAKLRSLLEPWRCKGKNREETVELTSNNICGESQAKETAKTMKIKIDEKVHFIMQGNVL